VYCLPIEPEELNPFRLDEGFEPVTLASPHIITALLQKNGDGSQRDQSEVLRKKGSAM